MVKKKTARIGASLLSCVVAVTSTFCMGTFAASAANSDVQSSGGTSATAVLNNEAGWSTCNVYYWGNGGGSKNNTWPGVALTDADKNADGYYEVEISSDYLVESNGVIFNNGSEQSADLDIAAGECKIYNNKTKTWEDYDSNSLKLSLTTDVASPQYNGTDIVLNATTSGGSGEYTYTFKANSTTLYTGSNNTYTWTPDTAGTYTLSVSVSDTAGNSNSKSLTYEIKDDTNATEPVLKGITIGSSGYGVVNSETAVNVNASGGKVGTNLLFYKVAVTDPSGNPVNTVYYKQSNILNFTPTTTGDYKATVTVQNSYNKTVEKSYTIPVKSIGDITLPSITSFTTSASTVTAGSAVTLKTVVSGGTANYTYKYYVNGTVVSTKTSSSTTSSYSWTPSTAGTYTLKVTVTDANSNTVTKTISNYTVTEPSTTTVDPVISSFTTSASTVSANTPVTLTTKIKSGTGTANFTYTFKVNGTSVNVQKLSSRTASYTWTPTEAGTYTLKVVVKDANGVVVAKTISDYVVTSASDIVKGDVTGDGKVNVADSLYVLKSVTNISGYTITKGTDKFTAADMDGNGSITIADAVLITRAYLSA
ncbi:MAG: starch-binding protein [Acutalibacteraceae bacterium]|nr:starch-binding protein [Acutalibacteraceae bacterium]